MAHIWKNPLWPNFNWNQATISPSLIDGRFLQGKLLALKSDFIHSFEVSETKKHLFAEILDPNFELSLETLNGWQASLFPTGFAGTKKVKIAEFRQKDLAPYNIEHPKLPNELESFLLWRRESPQQLDPILKSALSFFWFLIVSPYEAGNFDLACALAELTLQKSENDKIRFYDLSAALEDQRTEAIALVSSFTEKDTDVTKWLEFYLQAYQSAVNGAYVIADKNVQTNLLWKKLSLFDLNNRQRKLLVYLIEENLEQEVTNKFYRDLCKTTRESAKRDLVDLQKNKILKAGDKLGRSVSYHFNLLSAE